ncbi:MAG TPA: (d)CMP kinase [Jatrophihabitantaceae bacterium]|nr:(d)CMP kinase [Jatrophihabitantaceae bacterium]
MATCDQPLVRPAATEFAGVIALDGPSGTGKSTVAKQLAIRLGARYLDTGAMYRAATVAVLNAGIDPADAVAVAATVASATLEIDTDPACELVTVNGDHVEQRIRTAEVTSAVSAVSAVPAVRARLVAAQQALIGDGGIVVEGRDIAAVVWPSAELKVFLTADAEERARRRAGQVGASDLGAVAAGLARRDRLDSSRAVSPLTRTADAVEVDTTTLSIDEVVDLLVGLASGASVPDA